MKNPIKMSKAEEKTIELMKKAKDFIPDGGYSEKELNLAFFMFIKGYLQAEENLELTWEDIMAIDDLLDELLPPKRSSDEFALKGYYEEVLKRFKERKEKLHHKEE